ncbi:hypothetical protein IAU60_003109 [Kwoniella sp. DSM 27419]
MASPPSFSSFPDLSAGSSAGPSQPRAPAVPSFASFPELDTPVKRHRTRSGSRERATEPDARRRRRDHVSRQEERSGRDERGQESRSHRHHQHDDLKESVKDRSQRDRNRSHREEGSRRRSRSRSRERHRRDEGGERDHGRDKHRDRSAERRYRNDRRKRDREAAEQLIRGSNSAVDGSHEGDHGRGDGKRSVKASDEGVPWYEASGRNQSTSGHNEPFDPTSSKAFFVDTVGDRDVARYDNTSSMATPRYIREGRNRILGMNDGLRVVYSRDRTQKGLEIAPLGRPYVPRYNARQTQSAAAEHLQRILLGPAADQPAFDPDSSYVDFGLRSKRLDPDDLPSYRSITHAFDEGDDLSVMQAAIGPYSTLEDEVRRRTAEMERHLRSHPEDVDSWLEYSQLHLRLSPTLGHQASAKASAQLNLTRANAEVTLSVLSRALDADEANMTSIKLHLAYLRAAEQFWPAEKVTGRWKNVLRELGERGGREIEEGWMQVWLAYISWREGQGFGQAGEKGGGVDEVIEVYIDCIGRLRGGLGGSDTDPQAREENLVYLFLRACLFLKQSGYTERALAAFQAQMEITFFRPDDLRRPAEPSSTSSWFDLVLTRFEDFWDAEFPRIGESGAQGWRASTEMAETDKNTPSSPLIHSSEDPFERWLEAETYTESTYATPGRATDLDAATEDDPYHVVLFSDIQPLLFPVTTPEVRLQLIYGYITFLGLPFSPPEAPSSSPANTDPHLRWSLAYNPVARQAFWPVRRAMPKIAWQTVGGEPMEPEHPRGMDDPFGCPVKCWVQDRGTILTRQDRWFADVTHLDLNGLDINLIRNSLSLLRPLVPDPSFTLAYFAFESAVSPKGAVKAAKTILALDRENLLLWDGYARLERQRGNVSAARTVYVTALQAARALRHGEIQSEDELDLWAGWAEMEWESSEDVRCLEVLSLAAGVGGDDFGQYADPGRAPTALSTVAMLKTRQYYASRDKVSGPSHLLLTALFQYSTGGIESARDAILGLHDTLPAGSAEAEEALQFLAKIIHLHTTRHPSPAALSRHVLEQAIRECPKNTSFLSLYLYGELGGRVYGRVQRLIADLSSKDDSAIVVHLWAVWAEAISAHRTFWDKGGGGAERVRLALDRGISAASGRYSVPLWQLYIEFECLMGRHHAAKQLCYRAVTALGGCKPLYLIPFSPILRPYFTPRELKDWGELMIERGLRLRVPFDGYWTNDDEDEGVMALPEDEEMGEDELGFLREREVLKPY